MIMMVEVIISNTIRKYDKKYTYKVPEYLENQVYKGIRVIVPFGPSNTKKEGFVYKMVSGVEEDFKYKIKPIIEVIANAPSIQNDLVDILEWFKNKYICTYHAALKLMIPPGVL